ncbi:MAG: branched-chain amino acid ABC transporter permease [Candidatus Rokubacteria bacterium]|nr:branched-chain amino acid ABC transporter permease [Candidatus Rokubacteria bacterium]
MTPGRPHGTPPTVGAGLGAFDPMKPAFAVALGALVLLLSLYPMVGSGYGVRALLQMFMWIALASSWNLISGLTGYVSFGHVAFFGAGAYATGILVTKGGWPWLPASLAGGVAACVLALVIGYPCLRLKGPYFAIAMLGLNEVLRALVSYFEGLTGGGFGLSFPTLHATVPIYYVMGLVAAAVTLLTYLIITSRFGLRLMTIREDEVAAEAMGIDTARYKLYAFLLSAVGPGIVGGLAARDQGYIEPVSVFPLATTITMIVMVLFGGKGTVWGPVLGAVVLFVFQELVWAKFIYLHQLLFGAIIVAVVLLMPRGVLGLLQMRYRLPRTI